MFLRHRTSDRYILNEIFGLGLYDLPAGATATLAELGRPPLGVDLGAHVGLWRVLLRLLPRRELDAFEPDPANSALLKRCISANRLADRWRLTPACAATADRTALLLADRFAESRITGEAPGAIEVASRDVLPFLAAADLVKIDIEGFRMGDPRRSTFRGDRRPRSCARVPPARMSWARPPRLPTRAHAARLRRRRDSCPARATRRGDAVGLAPCPFGLVRIICLVTGQVRAKAGRRGLRR